MFAESIMDSEHTSLRPDHKIRSAAQCIMEKRYRSVPVTDENGRYLGLFGVTCLLKQVIPKAAIIEDGLENLSFVNDTLTDLHQRFTEIADQPISICMNQDAPTVAPDTPLIEALLILYRSKVSLPVVERESGKLLGMITYWGVGEKILAS
ncbi:MAG TPA: CBS domain-containing protein [Gammaproteobacteria bacterium]|nr:CBS domain-containing protein [Gammaproteobacteria bacterium]